MSVAIGTQLGSLEITALLGKGGMGEVYRARDTKLKREVAIKILPDEFARDPDRVSRFQREAEVLASLNHPNIAAIYDLQEANDSRFLVLELVEGDTLADRLQIPISVCHYPPGTSKWNKIEHRLFSFISLNWRGKPLRTFETMVNMIGATRTRSGLKVKALLDTHPYEKGMKVSAVQFNERHIRGRQFHPDWNYTLVPRSDVHQ